MRKKCVCGHEKGAHQHYRGGSDCTMCGEQSCASFTADTLAGRLIGALTSNRAHGSATPSYSEPVDIRRGAA